MKERVRKARNSIQRTVNEELGEILGRLGEDSPEGQSEFPCPKLVCSNREAYRSILMEAIRDIEETRSSFRSSRLAVLRKKLLEALDALPGDGASG